MSKYATWLPVADWSGRLILPQPAQRRADGSVFFEIENAPQAQACLRGRVIRLAPDPHGEYARRTAAESVDLVFSDETKASLANNNNHPVRLDGWRSVKPFESLAGSRAADDVRVALYQPRIDEGPDGLIALVDREPVQIEGVEKALVRFIAPQDAGELTWLVAHWNPASRDFDGATEILSSEPVILPGSRKVPHTSLSRVHTTAINQHGFYVYTEPAGGGRRLKAIEPRALSRPQPAETLCGTERTDEYLQVRSWDRPAYGSWSCTELMPQTRADWRGWQAGDSGLVLHLFAWRGGPNGDPPGKDGHVPGHFATGSFRIIADPFTGDPLADITYAQVYSHNPEAIVSGFFARHAFLGSLARGWQWVSPVSDILLQHRAFQDIRGAAGEVALSPQRELSLAMSRMVAHTRIGGGTGIVPANMAVSCSQNSALALLEGLSAISAKGELAAVCRAVKRVLLPRGIGPVRLMPARWRAWLAGRPYRRRMRNEEHWRYLNAFLTINSVLPRELHDRLALALCRQGAGLLAFRANQVGGVIDGIEPQWPTTFKRKYPVA